MLEYRIIAGLYEILDGSIRRFSCKHRYPKIKQG